MKKILGNKTAILLVAALLVGFGGTVLYLSMIDNSQKEDQKNEETKQDEGVETQTEKGGGLPAEEATTKTPDPVQEEAPTSDSTSLGNISSSVTAQKSVSDDSISILFYLEGAGTFTVQEKVSGAWQTTQENVSYAGSGGLQAGTLTAGQSSKTMRVLKIENGKYNAVTKEFTVTRSEVDASLGIKTYN